MPSLFKRKRGDETEPAAPRRRRYLPPPSRLRRERRALLRYREQRIHDLGGLVLEMYRQDQFRQDVIHEQAAELVALFPGTRFCPSCGQALEAQAGS